MTSPKEKVKHKQGGNNADETRKVAKEDEGSGEAGARSTRKDVKIRASRRKGRNEE